MEPSYHHLENFVLCHLVPEMLKTSIPYSVIRQLSQEMFKETTERVNEIDEDEAAELGNGVIELAILNVCLKFLPSSIDGSSSIQCNFEDQLIDLWQEAYSAYLKDGGVPLPKGQI